MGQYSVRLGIGLAALAIKAAFAQPTPLTDVLSPDLDLSSLDLSQPREETRSAVIDFENVQGAASENGGIALVAQYEQSHGLTFGRGASVHVCAQAFAVAQAALCPYPQAASGARAAVHDVRAGGPAMTIDFSRPITSISMRINPTGGALNEIFFAELNGYDAEGRRVATNSVRFSWFQDAFTWPTQAELNGAGASLARVTVELRRVAANNQPVRFLFDDLTTNYPPDLSATPVIAALSAVSVPPRVGDAAAVQSSGMPEVQDALRIYPAATRVRAAIDWDGVDQTLGLQKDLQLDAAEPALDTATAIAELPLLLPSRADPGTLSVVGGADSYHASFEVEGRAYSLYGSRVLTMIGAAQGAPAKARNLSTIRSNHALMASFSLYGAAYTLTRYCRNDSALEDPACHDLGALGEIANELVVAIGAAGALRP